MKRILLTFCLAWMTLISGCATGPNRQTSQNSSLRQSPHLLDRPVTVKLDYLLYLPKDYNKQTSWPLLVFLHGAGERGSDLNLVKAHGPAKLIEEGRDFPFIVVSPQCTTKKWWPYMAEHVMTLIDEIQDSYHVDPDRIYLTGLSMGGFGTWGIAEIYPERFAAIAPICGGGEPLIAGNLKHIPVWVFHGDQDTVVSLQRSQEMVDAVNASGGNAKLTIYPDVGHDAWTQTYNNDELYEWLLSHSRKQD